MIQKHRRKFYNEIVIVYWQQTSSFRPVEHLFLHAVNLCRLNQIRFQDLKISGKTKFLPFYSSFFILFLYL